MLTSPADLAAAPLLAHLLLGGAVIEGGAVAPPVVAVQAAVGAGARGARRRAVRSPVRDRHAEATALGCNDRDHLKIAYKLAKR